MIKKIIIGGITGLMLLSSIPLVIGSEGKSDLFIEDIFLWSSNDIPWERHFECSVKNIGDANTPWY